MFNEREGSLQEDFPLFLDLFSVASTVHVRPVSKQASSAVGHFWHEREASRPE
jgi:hypothetical protein